MGELEETHTAIFQAMHNQGERLADVDAMVRLLKQYGVDEDEFRKTWASPGVKLKINQAKRLAKAYRATGVPTLIVNGKYRIEGGMRSEEHTSELQSRENLVCRLLLEKKKKKCYYKNYNITAD